MNSLYDGYTFGRDNAEVVDTLSENKSTRPNPVGMAHHEFRELANAFNAQLRMRLANFPHLIFWSHRHLDRYLYRSDGRHFESGGELRFYLSLRHAVKRGQRMFASLFA